MRLQGPPYLCAWLPALLRAEVSLPEMSCRDHSLWGSGGFRGWRVGGRRWRRRAGARTQAGDSLGVRGPALSHPRVTLSHTPVCGTQQWLAAPGQSSSVLGLDKQEDVCARLCGGARPPSGVLSMNWDPVCHLAAWSSGHGGSLPTRLGTVFGGSVQSTHLHGPRDPLFPGFPAIVHSRDLRPSQSREVKAHEGERAATGSQARFPQLARVPAGAPSPSPATCFYVHFSI